MSKPGNYTAYQQFKPLDNGTTQAIQYWSSFAEQKKQNDIANEQKDKALQDAKEKEDRLWIDGLLKVDAIKATGVKDVDELNAEIGAKTYENRTALVEKLLTQKPGTSEYLKTMALLNANGNIPKEINGIKNAVFENAKKYTEGRDETFTVEPFLDDFYKNLDNAEIVIDPNTQKAVVLIQDPEDPTKKISLTHQDILNGKGDFKLTPKFNMQTMAKETAKTLNAKPNSEDRIDQVTGYLLTEEGFDEPTIEQIAKNLFSDNDGKPTEAAISFSKQQGIYDIAEISKPENLAKLEAQFIAEIDPLMISKNKIKTNTIELQRKKNETDAEYKARMAAVAEKNANTKIAIGIGAGTIKQKPNPDVDFVTKSNQTGKPTFGVNIAENKFSIINQNDDVTVEQQIRDINIDPKVNGRIIINGITYEETPGDFSGKKPTKTPFSVDSNNGDGLAQVEKIAAHLGMNRQQLYDLIKNKMPKAKPKAKAQAKAKPAAKPTTNNTNKKKRKASDYGV